MSIINNFYNALNGAGDIRDFAQGNIELNVSYPINTVVGIESVQSDYWNILTSAMANIERKPFIEFASEYEGKEWHTATGYFVGTFTNDPGIKLQ